MTDATPEATTTLTEVLVRHAFYSQYGITRIAVDDNTLANLASTSTTTVTPGEVTLVDEPGSPEWVNRMVRIRSTLIHSLENTQGELRDKINHLERLGEALLEQANERGWCEEYDTFAEEWDLPKRVTEWEVTMTVRVNAPTEEAAIEIVQDNVSIDRYSTEGIEDDPEFHASTV